MHSLGMHQRPWIPLMVVAIVCAAAFALLSPQFLTTFNIYVILSNAALLCVIGLAQMVVLSVGEFSLAVGGIGALTGIVVGYLLIVHDCPLWLSLLAGLATAGICGVANGVLVARVGVSGFVITLATGGLFSGISLAITRARSFGNLPELLTTFGTGRIGFLPFLLPATIVTAIGLAVLYAWLRPGRAMLAVGRNTEAAELSGLSRARAVIWAHTLSGFIAGVAGIMAMAQLHEANPLAGLDWLIQSFTIAIIGGTSLTGGSVSVVGVIVAALILATIDDGLILINVNPYWVTLVEGLLIFLAVVIARPGIWERYREASARIFGTSTRFSGVSKR